MRVKDCHTHAGGYEYFNGEKTNYSSISNYLEKIKDLESQGVQIEEFISFAQPSPYYWLANINISRFPAISFKQKNDCIGKETLLYENVFMAVFVDYKDFTAYDEIKRCVKLYNPKAIKLHAATSSTNASMIERYNIIRAAEECELPIIIHTHCNESNSYKKLFTRNKNTSFIIPHLGYFEEGLVELVKNYDNVYFDTSALTHNSLSLALEAGWFAKKLSTGLAQKLSDLNKSLGIVKVHPCISDSIMVNKISEEEMTAWFGLASFKKKPPLYELNHSNVLKLIVEEVGSEKVLFGSDEAWCSIQDQIKAVRSAGLKRMDEDNLLYKNFNRLFPD